VTTNVKELMGKKNPLEGVYRHSLS